MPRVGTRDRAIRAVQDERAQGVIEFAVLSTVLLIVFLGVVDFSRFMYYSTGISNAARVGAETAMEYCSSPSNCGVSKTVMTDDVILQATVCESNNYVTLQPSVTASQCQTPCNSGSCATTSTCPTTSASACCAQDVCIEPAQPRSSGTDVTVTVGYNFQPISFLMTPFFNARSCWSGDPLSTHHTICAQAIGSLK